MTEVDDSLIDFDDWDWPEIHHFFRLLAAGAGEIAGIPVPIKGHGLQLEDRYPNRIQAQIALDLTGDGNRHDVGVSVGMEPFTGDEPREMSFTCTHVEMETYVRNCWYSRSKQANIYLLQEGDKVKYAIEHVSAPMDRLTYTLKTMDVAQAWSLDSEMVALGKLKSLIKPHLFAMYFLTGAFPETSKRSGVTYILRRARPTIATAPTDRKDPNKPMRFLAALCMHPLGFYSHTWAGAMVPTDDVLAHLLMIRGDEHLYWRRANQHPSHVPEAAL